MGRDSGLVGFAIGAMAVMATACKPVIPTNPNNLPDVAGEWSYTAVDIRPVGRAANSSCRIDGLTLLIGPWRDTGFFGRSEGGAMICTGDLQALSVEFPSYAVRNGGAVLNFIAFDIGTSDWRHDGTIAGDTMSGRFWIQHPGLRLEGNFRAELRKRGIVTASESNPESK